MRLILPSALVMLMVGYFLNRDFYPNLFPYQSETQVAFYLQKNNLSSNLATHGVVSRSTDFYLERTTPDWSNEELQEERAEDWLIFTNEAGLDMLKEMGKKHEIIKIFGDFHITTLKPKFINKKTRQETLINTYLIKVFAK